MERGKQTFIEGALLTLEWSIDRAALDPSTVVRMVDDEGVSEHVFVMQGEKDLKKTNINRENHRTDELTMLWRDAWLWFTHSLTQIVKFLWSLRQEKRRAVR
jgi:hypothetical protein